MIKDIKRGYGWIEPEYVVDSWDNVSDAISFDLVKGEVYKRLFNAGLLYHSSANGKDKGAKVTLSELGALALMKESSTFIAESAIGRLQDKVAELVKNLSGKEYKEFAFNNDIDHRNPMEMQDFIQSLTDKEAEDILKQF